MGTTSRTAAASRAARRTPRGGTNPFDNGQPDPRPITEYSVAVSVVGGNTRVTVTLDQPCVIRAPHWAFIDNTSGTRVYAPTMVVVDNRTFYFQFAFAMPTSIGTIEVPYQDLEVRNFQGGFVRPGGQWFRKAL